MRYAATGLAGHGAIKIAHWLQQRFRGIGEARQAHFAATAPQRFECFLDNRAACHPREKLADQGKNHSSSCEMRSTRREVEKPGSSGRRTTCPPAVFTASSSAQSFALESASPPCANTS